MQITHLLLPTGILFTSLLTQQVSIKFNTLISRSYLATADTIARGVLLAFGVCMLLPGTIAHFGTLMTVVYALVFFAFIFSLEGIFQIVCQIDIPHKPWIFYALLLPHCIFEGFSAASLKLHSNMTLLLAFLSHKISEISIVTLSSEIHLEKKNGNNVAFSCYLFWQHPAQCLHLYN